MKRYRAKLTGKGQVQVPRAIREALGAERGDSLVFQIGEGGAVYVTAEPRVLLAHLAGSLRPGTSVTSFQEERETLHQHLVERERHRRSAFSRQPKPPTSGGAGR